MAKKPYAARQAGAGEGTPRGLEPFVLLRLAEAPAHGYELAQELAALGFRRAAADPSALYKLLRGLERSGLAASSWADGAGGPPRRVYALTPAGQDELHARALALDEEVARFVVFTARYRAWAERARRRGRRRTDGPLDRPGGYGKRGPR